MRSLYISLLLFLTYIVQAQQLQTVDYRLSKEYEIADIKVSGTQFLNERIIAQFSGLTEGEVINIPSDDISTAIKNLWKQGLFSNIEIYITKIEGEKAFLDIRVEERPRLSRYSFQGVSKNEADELKDALNLIKGRVVTEDMKIKAVAGIGAYFEEKGFLNAATKIIELPDSSVSNSIMLKFSIKKGAKVKIDQIKFDGNKRVADRKLKKLLKNTRERTNITLFRDLKRLAFSPTEWFQVATDITPKKLLDASRDRITFRLFSSSRYIDKDFEDDKKSIIQYYNSIGHRDAVLIYDSTLISEDKTLLNINIGIDEGKKYYFRNITFNGNAKYSDSKLKEIVNIKAGTIFNQDLLDSKLFMSQEGLDLSSLYMDDGHLFFNVTPKEKMVEGDSIDLEIEIYEGPVATINKVIVKGNTTTKEAVIRRELRTLPGSKFSRSDIIRSQREIANLGFFDAENMNVIPIPNPENGTVDIEYQVVEKPSSQVEMSMGWGGAGLVGTLGLSFNNFSTRSFFDRTAWQPLPSGDGQKLSIRVQSNGPWFQSYNASFTEPWMGGKKPNSFSLSLYRTTQSNGVTRKRELEDSTRIRQSFTATGLTIGLGKRLIWPDDYFTAQFALNLQNYALNDFSSFIFNNGNANNYSGSFTLARNSIDQPLYPRTGSKLSLSLQATLPYSSLGLNNTDFTDPNLTIQERYRWIEYHKWRFDAEWYLPLSRDNKLILKTEAKFGFLGLYNRDIGISPFERFELGGDGIANFNIVGKDIFALRGYEVGDVMEGTSDGLPIFNKYTLELRYPLSLNPTSTIYVHGFVQGGNAWSNFDEYNPFEMKRSFGGGLRVFLPMFGLLGFDFGIPLDKQGVDDVSLLQRGRISVVLGFEPQ